MEVASLAQTTIFLVRSPTCTRIRTHAHARAHTGRTRISPPNCYVSERLSQLVDRLNCFMHTSEWLIGVDWCQHCRWHSTEVFLRPITATTCRCSTANTAANVSFFAIFLLFSSIPPCCLRTSGDTKHALPPYTEHFALRSDLEADIFTDGTINQILITGVYYDRRILPGGIN